MTENTVELPGFNELYMLVEVQIRAPENSVVLKETTAALTVDKNALPGAFTVRSGSIYKNCNVLRGPSTVSRRFKGYIEMLSDAWSVAPRMAGRRRTGPRLIHMDDVPQALRRYAEESVAHDQAKARITEEVYEHEINLAKEALGDTASEVSWPTREEFLAAHQLDVPDFQRLPADVTTPVSANLPANYVQAICKHYANREASMIANSFDDRKERIMHYLSSFATQLANARLQARTQAKLNALMTESLPSMARKLGREEQARQIQHLFASIQQLSTEPLETYRKDDDKRKEAAEFLSQYATQFANV